MVAPAATERVWRRKLVWLVPVLTVLLIFPPVHIRSEKKPSIAGRPGARTGASNQPPSIARGTTSPQSFAVTFWEQSLPRSFSKAVDAVELLRALEQDPTRAAKTFGRESGIGARPLFLVSGRAAVARVDDRGVWLDLGTKTSSHVLLLTGPVFGNQLRDVTGLIRIQDFSSFDFNAISTELNRLVETRVQAQLRKRATVGTGLTFVGAGEMDDASSDRTVLEIVPIRVTWP